MIQVVKNYQYGKRIRTTVVVINNFVTGGQVKSPREVPRVSLSALSYEFLLPVLRIPPINNSLEFVGQRAR